MSAYGGRGPEILGVSWALMIVATIVICLRACACYSLKNYSGGQWALFWAVVAWILGLGASITISVAVAYGLGNHIDIVEQKGNLRLANLYHWIWSTFCIMMIVFAKFSVVAFLLAIQGPTHITQKYIMFALLGISLALNTSTAFIFWFQCKPTRSLWDPQVKGVCPLVHANFALATTAGSLGALIDLYLALYPLVIVYKLRVSKRIKFFLGSLMGLGLFTAVCSIVKTYQLRAVTISADATYEGTALICWGIAEGWVMLIASGIPAIWPVIKKFGDELRSLDISHVFTSIVPNTLRSGRRSDSSTLTRRASDGVDGVSMMQTSAFKRLSSDNGSQVHTVPQHGIGVTKTYAVQREEATSESRNTLGYYRRKD